MRVFDACSQSIGALVARVAAVHGINNTFSGAPMMGATWVPALLSGVDLAGRGGLLSPSDIECAFYGDVFRRPGRPLGSDDLEWLSADDLDEEEAHLLQRWWLAASDTDSGVVAPGARTLGIVNLVHAALAALSGSKFVAGTTERLLLLWLYQVKAYFTKQDVRELVQRRFADAIRDDTRVVVAHSLGSVVAYEALCAHPDWNVTTLITLGSPLGIRNLVLDRLTPPPAHDGKLRRGRWPGPVHSWTNIVDRIDFVALVRPLRTVFGDQITDLEINNGVRLHDVLRYLTAEQTGRAIVDGLRAAGEEVGRSG